MDALGIAVRSDPAEWQRGASIYEAGWLTLDPDRATRYLRPSGVREIVFDLAAVRTPSDAVAFIRTYGLLWHGPGDRDMRERFSDWEREAWALRGLLGMLVDLRQAVAGDTDAMERIRDDVAEWPNIPELPGRSDTDVLWIASDWLAGGVSSGLKGVEQSLESESRYTLATGALGRPDRFVFVARAENLRQAVYYELAHLLAARAPLQECSDPDCGRFFVVDDPRRQYCSSTCAGRVRQRKYLAARRSR